MCIFGQYSYFSLFHEKCIFYGLKEDHSWGLYVIFSFFMMIAKTCTLFPRIHRHAVMYETEGSRHAVIASPNSLKTMLTKNGCVSYITACRKTETPNSNIFTWGPCAWVSNSKMKTFYGGQCSCFLTLFFFHKKPSKRLSPQSFLKKWLLEPSKFLNGFLIPIIFFY